MLSTFLSRANFAIALTAGLALRSVFPDTAKFQWRLAAATPGSHAQDLPWLHTPIHSLMSV